ncbi:MAG TPA: SPOR domain-containing protein [Desulfobacteraceae bacterium]|nr:SPOR domain-containing protein [Desulfobacteraceae bacterium]
MLRVTETVRGEGIADISIQVGAFRNEAYAKAMVDRLALRLDKDLVIIHEDGYHKVRIQGFESVDEMERLIPSLGILGLNEFWIIPLEEVPREKFIPIDPAEMKDVTIDVVKPDTELQRDDLVLNEAHFSLQVAVFPKRTQAMRAKRKIERKLNLPVEIVQQWDYYRVIVRGFFTPGETYRYYPELAGLGFNNIILIDNRNR